jgi:hypothetical protein
MPRDERSDRGEHGGGTDWLRRIGWLVLLWTAGVASVAAVAWLMRELMKWAGMA